MDRFKRRAESTRRNETTSTVTPQASSVGRSVFNTERHPDEDTAVAVSLSSTQQRPFPLADAGTDRIIATMTIPPSSLGHGPRQVSLYALRTERTAGKKDVGDPIENSADEEEMDRICATMPMPTSYMQKSCGATATTTRQNDDTNKTNRYPRENVSDEEEIDRICATMPMPASTTRNSDNNKKAARYSIQNASDEDEMDRICAMIPMPPSTTRDDSNKATGNARENVSDEEEIDRICATMPMPASITQNNDDNSKTHRYLSENISDEEEIDHICATIPMPTSSTRNNDDKNKAAGNAIGNVSDKEEITRISATIPMPFSPMRSPHMLHHDHPTDMATRQKGNFKKASGDARENVSYEADNENDEEINERNKLSQSLTQEEIDWEQLIESFPDEEETWPTVFDTHRANGGSNLETACNAITEQYLRSNQGSQLEIACSTSGKKTRNDDDDKNPNPSKIMRKLPPKKTATKTSKTAKSHYQLPISNFFVPNGPTVHQPGAVTNNNNSSQAKDRDASWEYCGRNYKKGDVWKCNVSKFCQTSDQDSWHRLEGFLFTIGERCKSNGLRTRVGIEATHLLLTDTFLGPKYGKMLAESRGRQGKSAPDKVRYVTAFLPDDKSLFLRLLTERVQQAPESTAGPTNNWATQGVAVSDLLYKKSKRKADDVGGAEKKKRGRRPVSLKEEACAFFYEVQQIRKLDVSRRRRKKPTALDIFSGAGGMSLGLVEAGFDVTHHVDNDRDCCCTLERNIEDSMVIPEDIRLFIHHCKMRRAKVYPRPGDFNHVHGSPPCQGFSDAHNGGKNDSHNNSLTLVLVEAILYFQPDTFTIENVLGMERESRGRKEYLEHTIFLFLEAGYQVRTCVLRASDYGDPQDRERIILFGAKRGVKLPAIPKATHGPGLQEEIQTCQDVLGCLENISPILESGFVELPCGKLVRDHCTNGQPSDNRSNRPLYIVADKPAPTLLRKTPIVHYSSYQRLLTIREYALLQSFPIDYIFSGDHKSIRGQIGNAVPTRLANAIGKAVMHSYGLESCATLQDEER